MKTKIFLGCIMAASLITVSCSDLLQENPQGKLTPEGYFSTQEELDMSVYSLYSKSKLFTNSYQILSILSGREMIANGSQSRCPCLDRRCAERTSHESGRAGLGCRFLCI